MYRDDGKICQIAFSSFQIVFYHTSCVRFSLKIQHFLHVHFSLFIFFANYFLREYFLKILQLCWSVRLFRKFLG